MQSNTAHEQYNNAPSQWILQAAAGSQLKKTGNMALIRADDCSR